VNTQDTTWRSVVHGNPESGKIVEIKNPEFFDGIRRGYVARQSSCVAYQWIFSDCQHPMQNCLVPSIGLLWRHRENIQQNPFTR